MKLMLYVFPFLFFFFTFFGAYISFSVLIKKKPIVINSNWLKLIIFMGFLPAILIRLIQIDFSKGDLLFNFSNPIIYTLLLVFYYFIIKGYYIYGIKDDDFRASLINSFEKLELKYSEKLNKFKLEELGTELNISFQEWIGTGMIKLKNNNNDILKKIIIEIRKYILENNIISKKITAIFYLFFTIFSACMSIWFTLYALSIIMK